jgi:hypothetical protein
MVSANRINAGGRKGGVFTKCCSEARGSKKWSYYQQQVRETKESIYMKTGQMEKRKESKIHK